MPTSDRRSWEVRLKRKSANRPVVLRSAAAELVTMPLDVDAPPLMRSELDRRGVISTRP
jgi:hypothetical protein